jgi:hypothetical protein
VGDGVGVLTSVGTGKSRVILGNGTRVGVSVGNGVEVGVAVNAGAVGVRLVGVGGRGDVVIVAVPAKPVAVGVAVRSGTVTAIGEEYSEKPLLLSASRR